jgi:hypothetical protein
VRIHIVALLSACAACSGPSPAASPVPASRRAATGPEISARDLEQRLYAFADDSMRGRVVGDIGDYKAADYVASEFTRLGLQPAGDHGTYFQTVPFYHSGPDPSSTLEVNGRRLVFGTDMLPGGTAAMSRNIDGARAMYGGTISDSSTWLTADQVKGRVIVFDVPAGSAPAGARGGGRGGATGTVQTNPRFATAAALVLVQLDQLNKAAVTQLREGSTVRDSARRAGIPPELLVTKLAAAALVPGYPSIAPGTPGSVVHGHFDVLRVPVSYEARNVIAIIQGSDPRLRGEYVSVTAHNDHIGFNHAPVDHDSIRAYNRVMRPMGADSRSNVPPTTDQWAQVRRLLDSLRIVHPPRLDSIANGADDDGSGTVGLLEIAEALAAAPVKPKRSILFVSHTAEETGLVGSAWYTDHPTVPLDSIVAEIDVDMIGRGAAADLPEGGPTYLEVVGARRLSNEFGDMLEAANRQQPVPFVFNYSFDVPGHPLQYYCRADHYSYARYGIPSVSLSRGEHLDYHQVTDEPQYIDYPDLARVTRMVYDAAVLVANADHRPRLDSPRQADPHAQCRQ